MTAELTATWTGPRPAEAKLVVVTGVFDLLHVGHARFLRDARAAGSGLVVGVESDRRVAAWKGPDRPVNTAAERAELLAALRVVDGVFLIDGDPAVADWRDYVALLRPLAPSVLAFTEGDPFREGKLLGATELDATALEVPLVPAHSSTGMLNQLRG